MARAKDRPATPAKSAKATKAPQSAKTAPGTPGMEAISPTNAGSRMTGAGPTPEQVYRMIQETAYFKAKARNFAPGHEVQDWIEAEAEVRMRLENRV
jgi:hypothetical protein